MLSIFVSYSRSDSIAVEQLALDLRNLGCAPWFDTDLVGGADWWKKILSNIRSCDLFIYALSPESLDSPACKSEFSYARALRRRTLPIQIADGVNASTLPRDLASIQLVDYRKNDKRAITSLARSLLGLETPEPLPAELPREPAPPLSYLGELREDLDEKSLDFDRQSSLILRVKEFSRVNKTPELRELLLKFRRRHDVYAIVAEELDEILRDSGSAKLATAPVSYRDSPPIVEIPSPGTPQPVGKIIKTESLVNQNYGTLKSIYSDKDIMRTLGITPNADKFAYMNYTFSSLQLAVDYALKRFTPRK